MEYGSPESLEFTDLYFMLLNYWTLVESNNHRQRTGRSVPYFEKSAYADGSISQTISQGITNQNQTKSSVIRRCLYSFPGEDGPHGRSSQKRRLVPPKPFREPLRQMVLSLISMIQVRYPSNHTNDRRTARKENWEDLLSCTLL